MTDDQRSMWRSIERMTTGSLAVVAMGILAWSFQQDQSDFLQKSLMFQEVMAKSAATAAESSASSAKALERMARIVELREMGEE